MGAQRILFPTDFSHRNDPALSYASTLAADANAELLIVHVDERYDLSSAMGEAGYVYPLAYNSDRRSIHDELTRVAPTIVGVKYEHHYLQGSPVAEIIKSAKRERVDLIVMGSHGRTGLSRLLMGSVAEGVMRRAQCPVLVVKQPTVPADWIEDPGTHVLQE